MVIIMKNIVLTGFMASGKSTIGRCIAKKMNMQFVDTDEYIVAQEKMTINDIFSLKGEEYFRELEGKCAVELSKIQDTVIATGGGFVLNGNNIELLRKNGIIVNLKTNPKVIKQRLDGARGPRPLLQNSELEEILTRFEKRKPYYDNCDIQIELNCKNLPEDYTEQIISKINNRG